MLARSDPWRFSDGRLLPHPVARERYNFFAQGGVKKVA